MARATDTAMDALHAAVADTLKDELTKARKGEGGVPSSLLNAVIKFLKDNGVDAPAKSERLNTLADELMAIDLDEAAEERLH